MKELTLEQLEDMEVELREKEEQKDGHYAQLIHLYKELYNKLVWLAKKDSEPNRIFSTILIVLFTNSVFSNVLI